MKWYVSNTRVRSDEDNSKAYILSLILYSVYETTSFKNVAGFKRRQLKMGILSNRFVIADTQLVSVPGSSSTD